MNKTITDMSYEEFEKEMLLAYIRNMPVQELLDLHIELFNYEHIHRHIIEYVQKSGEAQVEVLKKVINNIGKDK